MESRKGKTITGLLLGLSVPGALLVFLPACRVSVQGDTGPAMDSVPDSFGVANHESSDTGPGETGLPRESASPRDTAQACDTGDLPGSVYADCVVTLDYDYLLDGSSDERIITTYDSSGYKLLREYDIDGNGTVDAWYSYAWSDDLLVDILHDEDADDIVDETWHYTWAGELLQSEEHDQDADGVTDSVTNWEYDSDDRESQATVDDGPDGVIDEIWTWGWTISETGTQEQILYDTDADGSTDVISTYVYDSDGRLLVEEYDADADGTANLVEYTSWDEAGRRLALDVDYDGDGTDEVRYSFFYDCLDRTDYWELDWYVDGSVDGLGRYSYECDWTKSAGTSFSPRLFRAWLPDPVTETSPFHPLGVFGACKP